MVENVKSTITETERAEKAYFITTKELAEAGRDNIPDELISSKHQIKKSFTVPAGYTCVQFTGSAGVWCEESGTGDSGFGHASFSSGMLRKEYNYFK